VFRIERSFHRSPRESRSPSVNDLQLIENASHITGIAIERHMNEEELRHERDRLRLLLEIANSMTSKLDLRRFVEAVPIENSVCSCKGSRKTM
jgi:formate hydrogenlyase transcriptional activator